LAGIEVQSNKGEPLRAEISVSSATAEEWGQLVVRVAPAERFAQLGLVFTPAVGQLQAELLETAEIKFPNSKELKLQKAFIIGKYGKINTGLAIIETLKQEAPNDPRPLAVESNLYFLQGDLEKAEMSLKWAISLQKTSPFFHNNIALIYERMSDLETKAGKKEKAKENLMEAEKSVTKAISLKEYPQMILTLKRIQEKLSTL
jgi:tetratricopeptide (TPR) repeat protein